MPFRAPCLQASGKQATYTAAYVYRPFRHFPHNSEKLCLLCSTLNNTLTTLLLYNNQFEGALDMFSDASTMQLVSSANNPALCGMVPASLRWAHGYNPHNTSLGQPCS